MRNRASGKRAVIARSHRWLWLGRSSPGAAAQGLGDENLTTIPRLYA
jgi:hypothetical protein